MQEGWRGKAESHHKGPRVGAVAFLSAVEALERERLDQIWVSKRPLWLQWVSAGWSSLKARRLARRLWPWVGEKLEA